MKKVGLIGYGRFGKVLHDVLSKEYQVQVYDANIKDGEGIELCNKDEVLEHFLVFISVPIREFKQTIIDISGHKLYNTTIIDVCSVKVYPVDIMKKYLPDSVGIIASHPHFGPDSFSPLENLKLLFIL